VTDALTPSATDRRITVAVQIAWAEAQASQHARLAARAQASSPVRTKALERERIARAAAENLRRLSRPRKPRNPS
jgi:hypothetical protein